MIPTSPDPVPSIPLPRAGWLSDRALIRLGGLDVVGFLQGLVTSDVTGALPVWAGLLTPQGKVLFDFLIWADGDAVLLDCEASEADALLKRLSIYRLRRPITIASAPELAVVWRADDPGEDGYAQDPRLAALGWRRVTDRATAEHSADAADGWRAHRLALGVTEGIAELGSGTTLWLECNAAELNGVSFTKGCYVGQENTARMNWRQKVNRRLLVQPSPTKVVPALGALRIDYSHLNKAVALVRVDPNVLTSWPNWLKPSIIGTESASGGSA